MEMHREDTLNSLMDQLYLEGATFIRWDRMYLWYGKDKIKKLPWRDIQGRWEKLCRNQGFMHTPPLRVLLGKGIPGALIQRDAFEGEEIESLHDLAE